MRLRFGLSRITDKMGPNRDRLSVWVDQWVHTSTDVAADDETLLHVGQFRNAAQKMQHLVSGLCASCRPSCWFQVQATHTLIVVALQIISHVFCQLEHRAFHLRSRVWLRQPDSIFTGRRRPA